MISGTSMVPLQLNTVSLTITHTEISTTSSSVHLPPSVCMPQHAHPQRRKYYICRVQVRARGRMNGRCEGTHECNHLITACWMVLQWCYAICTTAGITKSVLCPFSVNDFHWPIPPFQVSVQFYHRGSCKITNKTHPGVFI